MEKEVFIGFGGTDDNNPHKNSSTWFVIFPTFFGIKVPRCFGPSLFFLLLLHLYELYGIVKRGEKSIPLTLNLMYFNYIIIKLITMIGLNSFYQRHDISQKFLTSGWSLAVALLCMEVILALLLAKYIITIFITRKLPHFFKHLPKKLRIKPFPVQRHVIKPKRIYYLGEKPDKTLRQNEESFVRYK